MKNRRDVEKLGMKKSHRESVLANLARGLIENSFVETTFVRAKASQRYTERVISLARRGDLSARRTVFSRLQDKAAVDKLFDELGPKYKDRAGGYTRIVKLGPRKGDGAEQARLMLV
jgi:large subunit ribosomal protein L17